MATRPSAKSSFVSSCHIRNAVSPTEAVVLAANRRGAAAVATNTDDADRVAIQTDGDVQSLDDDAEQAKDEGGDWVTGRRDAVAALDRACVALAGWSWC